MNLPAISPDRTLDCSGLGCPMPVIKTAEAIKKLEVGQVLEVISTDPGSLPDMESYARQSGHELLDAREVNGKHIFYFRRRS